MPAEWEADLLIYAHKCIAFYAHSHNLLYSLFALYSLIQVTLLPSVNKPLRECHLLHFISVMPQREGV